MIRQIRGVVPVVHTPFLADDSMDYASLEREMQWALSLPIDGFCTGMVSELQRLTADERNQLHQWLGEFDRGDRCFVASVGAESATAAVQFATAAVNNGADAVMAIPPNSVPLNADELEEYFAAIVEAIPVPLIVQDASGYVGAEIPLSVSCQLFEKYGSERIMFKPEANPLGSKLSALRDATRGQVAIFEGSGGISLMDSYSRGIAGTIPGMEFLEQVICVWEALENGDVDAAYRAWFPLCALVSLQLQAGLDGFLAVEKYIMQRKGLFSTDRRRQPYEWEMDKETCLELERLLRFL
ncbi:MAG: dihydrodipicolinate synthase family protein [Planctomycetaceae bacterium]|nr:dihydrodipicolinate synthase family protein [Planctomycetaceae bacterium]MBT4723623.1 dihydrodipicolinate synthase family protein [Planctomycetaceae bacterium]MBT4844080.1 dihydrodipicolinate synthase family protein [Planctomycetaceae bacterium]MBT5125342.1 dihydrodipicolinate synthase family protein [Planctomycetaceae bacterium]MBT5598922.1 dihydrodipicolinate synthase family protein [Planctomycetaceae bacterium]